MFKKITCAEFDTSRVSPTPKGVYLWTFKKIIYEHLWLIDGHKSGLSIKYYILLRSSRASPTPKGGIYGHSKKIYEHLWLIDGHF